jgi:hypothetical protein
MNPKMLEELKAALATPLDGIPPETIDMLGKELQKSADDVQLEM